MNIGGDETSVLKVWMGCFALTSDKRSGALNCHSACTDHSRFLKGRLSLSSSSRIRDAAMRLECKISS